MKRKKRTSHSLRRREPFQEPRRLILIVCEGAKTEPDYFKRLRVKLKLSNIEVRVIGEECGSAPISVVNYAVDEKKQCQRNGLSYDEVWCVMDVENPPHSSLSKAVDKASANGIRMAWSNPCFELWFLLHFEKWSKSTTNQEVVSELKKHYKQYKKNDSSIFDDIFLQTKDAVYRSVMIKREKHCDKVIDCNPSTDVDILVGGLLQIVAQPTGVETC